MSANKYPLSLSQPVYSATQVLQNEALVAEKIGIIMPDLMDQAGTAAFKQIQQCWPKLNSMLVVCGKGNNGGDGFVIARIAHRLGIKTSVLLLGDAVPQSNAYLALLASGVTVISKSINQNESLSYDPEQVLNSFSGELIVDAIFGIGFHGKLSDDIKRLIVLINQNKAMKFSVDIPSGLSATTGNVESIAVNADVTITFIVLKQGLLTAMAANYIGELFLDDLSLGQAFIDHINDDAIYCQGEDNLPKLVKRFPASHKGNIGLVLAIGGNIGMPGAIRLAAEAALRCGAALLAVSCHQQNQNLVFNGRPELMLAASSAQELSCSEVIKKAKVLIIGPGLGENNWAEQMADLAFIQSKPCVIDADALHILAKRNLKNSRWVLTPHPKEAAVLLHCTVAEIELDRFKAVKTIANKYGGICLLKGAGSLISDGDQVWINSSGNAGMASGGMGDVLSGIIAALLLQMPDAFQAVRLACYIHGAAADRIAEKNGQRGMLASDLFAELQSFVNG